MKLNWSHWLYTLLKTVIGGAAGAGSTWLGTLIGNQIDSSVKPLDFRQLGIVLLVSTILNLFFFLKQSPLPEDEDAKKTSSLPLLLLAGLLSFSLIGSTVGCSTAQQRIAFNSLATVQTVTLGAYDGYVSQVVAGNISTNDVPKVSQRFNQFQAAYRVALDAAQYNTNALAPESLQVISKDLLSLITELSKKD